jgi:hypothetical protein
LIICAPRRISKAHLQAPRLDLDFDLVLAFSTSLAELSGRLAGVSPTSAEQRSSPRSASSTACAASSRAGSLFDQVQMESTSRPT